MWDGEFWNVQNFQNYWDDAEGGSRVYSAAGLGISQSVEKGQQRFLNDMHDVRDEIRTLKLCHDPETEAADQAKPVVYSNFKR